MRANVNVAQKKRYKTVLSRFRGLDLSASPLRVDASRATQMRNLICENGINHKRPGWREQLKLDGRINGIFPYSEGAVEILLVHAGERIYRVACTGERWSTTELTGALMLSNRHSQCFYRDGRAFLTGCGDFLTYGPKDTEAQEKEYVLQRVRDIAYVPTTTTAILPAQEEGAGSGATLDAVNLLTPIRKNVLSCVGADSKKWFLDGLPDDGSSIEIELDGTVDGSAFRARFSGIIDHKRENWLSNDFYEWFSEFDLGLSDIFGASEIVNVRVEDENGTLYGKKTLCSVNLNSNVSRNLSITVTFSCTTEGYEEKLKSCTTGVLFGENGANDRLFLTGNPDEIGMDRWSEAGDFTYFPDGNAMLVGGSEAPITGYARLSDSTMAVFKEQSSGYPTIYYRTGVQTSIVDADGDTIPAVYFPVSAGTIGEGLVNAACVANLAGDPLILSPDGVFGIELSANVSSGERYAKERSRAIYKELCKKPLAQAVACVYRGRYYLSLGDGEGICYVADSRYKATFDGSTDIGYEWWRWENVPATAFAVREDRLLFGDASGRLCIFCEGTYADRTRYEIKDGEMLQNEDGGLWYSEQCQPSIGDEMTFRGDLYALLLDHAEVIGERDISYPVELIHTIRDGVTVYVDNVGASGLLCETAYTICGVDPVSLTFRLCDANGEGIKLNAGGFRICENLKGRRCYVGDLDSKELELSLLDEGGRPLEIVLYDGIQGSIIGDATRSKPVVASWRTPVMDFGTASAKKCLHGITVTNEPGVGGAVKIRMETRLTEQELLKHGGSGFSLENLDFSALSLATDFAESCRRRVNVRNFNYAVFELVSDTASDVAVSCIELEYKINQVIRGVH